MIHFPSENSGNSASHLKLDAPAFVSKQSEETAEANSQSQFVATGIEKGKPKNVLLSTLRELVKNKFSQWVEVRCLLDVGSQSCLCTKACAERLQLRMERVNTVVSCVNDASMIVKNCVKTSVANRDKSFERELLMLVVNKITDFIPNEREYENLGHLERVVESSEPLTQYYIPHHGVQRPDKLTTKLRVVFNASSPTTTGIGLNDILMKGDVIEDVFQTISRFRRHKFAFTTDIQKMYRQILIDPDQQDLQRIVWKMGPNAEVSAYRLKTVTYGMSNAPFLAIRKDPAAAGRR
ncbi:hypothetical protein AVEN_97348-1 [Araneus ventricosus]|uniref:Peptidase aspartic putative domain-containing protein n=1 Tax=Araneus ventricosus TaxID=182803 RepID=A0A4Y2ABH0_ARAVE|nr:hypothetical protein AVEN_97348-1 [Araneus ventricosus]